MSQPYLLLAYSCCALWGTALGSPLRPQEASKNGQQTTPSEAPHVSSLPLSLDAALTLSETNNLGLMIEDLTTEVAHFDARGAWGNFDWIFGATARHTDWKRNSNSVFDGSSKLSGLTDLLEVSLSRPLETGGNLVTRFTSTKSQSNSANSTSPSTTEDQLSIAYTQPLLRGFGVERGTSVQRESDYLYLQAVERRREVRQKLLLDTSDAYWDLVQAIQQLGVAESSLELGNQQLQRNQRLLDAGVGTEVEVIQAEAEVARREETRLADDVSVRVASDVLKSLLFPGKDVESWETVLDPTTPLPTDVGVADLPGWSASLDTALQMRPEMREQQLQIEVARVRHERASSDRRLGLDLDTSISTQAQNSDWWAAKNDALSTDTITWVVGLTLDAPIRNRTRAFQERAARSQVRAARIGLEQTETQIASEVRDAVRQLRYQSLAVHAAGVSLEAARRQLSAEEARYENDLSTNFQVLEIQLQLVEAMNSEKTSQANFAKALYRLQAAEGTLGERR